MKCRSEFYSMKNVSQKIMFHYLVPPFFFPRRSELKRFLLWRIKKEGRKVEVINYIFCDDKYLLRLNKEHLNHNSFTDIITFELSARTEPLTADIYISVQRVRDNARTFHVKFLSELLRVIFHGMLHLIGYKDKSSIDVKEMRMQEEECLIAFSRGTNNKYQD